MNFRAPKVVKWATVLDTAENLVSVDPPKILHSNPAKKDDILPRAFVATWFELEQKLIQILFMNFCAPKVVKWATVLPTAANQISVDPSKFCP